MSDNSVDSGGLRISKAPFSRERDDYKNRVFYLWYNSGKPPARELYAKIGNDPDLGLHRPSMPTLANWIREEYDSRALALDTDAQKQLDEASVAQKVEMLRRHQKTALEMQDISLDYIREHQDELTIAAAIRLWEKGVELERISVGIPDTLMKLQDKTDDQIREEIKQLLTSGEISGLDEFDSE